MFTCFSTIFNRFGLSTDLDQSLVELWSKYRL